MKTKYLFQVLFFVAAMFMLQSCAEEEFQVDTNLMEEDDTAYRYAVGPGTPYDQLETCYYGGIAVDYDCDGSYGLGWNHSASSAGACQQMVQDKIATAIANGWCWTLQYHPNNCQASPCYVKAD